MNTNLAVELDEQSLNERREEETRQMIDALRGCLQTSLVGESQNFRSTVAAAVRSLRSQQRWALGLTAAACVLSAGLLAASISEGRHITHQAEARALALQKQAAAAPDAFADLRRANWVPAGPLVTQKGRTFVEVRQGK